MDLKAGESKQFTAQVKGKGEFSKEVIWEVAGNKDKDTRIDEKGNLCVSKGETSEEVNIKAISKADADKFDEVTVKIKREPVKEPENDKNSNAGTGKPVGNKGVQTGDESQVVMFLVMLGVAGGFLKMYRRKRQ